MKIVSVTTLCVLVTALFATVFTSCNKKEKDQYFTGIATVCYTDGDCCLPIIAFDEVDTTFPANSYNMYNSFGLPEIYNERGNRIQITFRLAKQKEYEPRICFAMMPAFSFIYIIKALPVEKEQSVSF